MRWALLALCACGGGDAMPDAAPPRETVTETRTLLAHDVASAMLVGGPADLAVLHFEAPAATLDWDLHAHASGGTQDVAHGTGEAAIDYRFTPSLQATWFLSLENTGDAPVAVTVRVELYGAMTWGWQ